MEPSKKYQPNIEPDLRPDLHVIKGGGESTPERGNLSAAQNLNASENETGKNSGNTLSSIKGGGESTPERGNLSAVSDAESSQGLWAGKSNTEQSRKLSLKGVVTGRRAASGSLIGIILALVGAISFIATPGLAALQMKEILTDDLNDQLGAMDKRSVYVMRAKLNDMGKGICTGVKINCGFKGMSNRQVSKFKAAGIEVETDGKTISGKNKIKSLTFTALARDELCKGCGGQKVKVTNPKEVNKYLAYPEVRNQLKKAFNPKFAGYFDAKWDSFKKKFNLTSNDKLGGGTEEDKKKAITSAVEGEPIDSGVMEKVPTTDDDGKPISDADKKNAEIDRVKGVVEGGGVSTTSVVGSAGKGAVKGIGVLGAADTACTVKNTARAVEAGAKVYRNRQLIAYSMVFLTFADSIKAGTATPEQAELVGNTLTAVDTNEKIVNENGTIKDGDAEKIENPYYGANAFDSAGYKTALYNDAPTLSARDMQMAIGGGVALGMLGTVNKFMKQNGADNCAFVQNWAVRGTSLVGGIALGVVTLGTWTVASIAASVAISMALPILENYLAQMISGTVADGDTKGVDAGNAIFAGAAGLMGGMAMSRGMKPATKSDLKTYLALNDEVKSEYVAIETENAKTTPFDVNNRYSFMGSLARTLLPARTTSSISVGNSLMNTFNTFSSAITLTPKAFAKDGYNEERFSKCEDSKYKEIGIDADVFCNVRYTMSPYELGLDTEEVRAQMLAWRQVNDDEEGSVVSGSDYEKWLKECTEREQGWGEVENQESKDGNGARCMNEEKEDHYYRIYTMDASIIAAMDYVPTETTNAMPEGEVSDGEIIDGLSKEGWVWPVPDVNSMGILGYGKTGSKGVHKGIDIGISGGGALNKKVVAAHDGVVNWVDTSQNTGCGSYISITATGTNYYAAYQHVNGDSILVKKDEEVKAGQVIAKIGEQGGRSCGSSGFYHLHFSIENKPGLVSTYADSFPNGTVDPLLTLPRP